MTKENSQGFVKAFKRTGWDFTYDKEAKYVSAEHPNGGRQSVCEIKHRQFTDEFGEVIADCLNNIGVLENLRGSNKAMAAVFTKIADYLEVEQGNVEELLETIEDIKESAELLSRMADLIEALRPFVDAFDKIKECHLSDNNELQGFKDSNLVIPSMAIGHFRKLHEAYNKLKGE